jgi:molybdate/tungstate transport system permease protein
VLLRWGPFAAAYAALLILLIGPVIYLLGSVSLPAVARGLAEPAFRDALRTSLLASGSAITAGTVLGVPAGYLLAHWPVRPRNAAISVLVLPLAFPPVTAGIIILHAFGAESPAGRWLLAGGRSVVDSLAGVAASEFFVSAPFIVAAAAVAFASLDPAIDETARTLGASPLRVFRAIALPLAFPQIAAGVLLAWLRALGEYGATSIVAYHPVSLPIYNTVVLSAGGLPAALPVSYGFIALAAAVVAVQWLLTRRFPR